MRTRKTFWRKTAHCGLLVFALTACTETDPLEKPTAKVDAPSMTVGVGEDVVILRQGESRTVVPAKSAAGTARETWASADRTIADVNQAGTITGVSVGTTMVTVSLRGKSTDLLVTVLPTQAAERRRVTYQ